MTCSHDSSSVIDFHLLGQVDYDRCLQLQRRLVYEAQTTRVRRIVVLLAEHPELITVGRSGSRAHIRWTNEELRGERLTVRWVGRGGGCILHAPGQLAIQPIIPLDSFSWDPPLFLERLSQAVQTALASIQVSTSRRPGSYGIWGRSGLLAAAGVSIRQGVSCHGIFLNVHPALGRFRFVDAIPPDKIPVGEKTTMSSLLAERRQPARMPAVRAALIESLSAAFDCERHNLHTGHPWLPKVAAQREVFSRAS
jgi:lipoyl(octanoyl) transferase